ncbi:hypothetical protein [Actinoplanes sp. NPDC049316]|uniref:hypothetical protein n=1 Tax=Actinoplanes sp. NPDC049316 TaxID=3154727 RepID=UPI00342D77FD
MAMHGDREKSIDSGAGDYVTKPVDAEDLLTCIERWLTQKGRPDELRRSEAESL